MDSLDRLQNALAGRYQVEREIGRGGMATVYLAQDLKHQRAVAIKVLNPELAIAIGPGRFLREIEIAARLSHPHILSLHDSGEADGCLYYIMPHVAGDTLRQRLDRDGRLPAEEAVRIVASVARALDYAHRHAVVHRDIKPENIMMHDGEPVVTDFGIALAAQSGGGRLTGLGFSVGTPHYMSPEQVASDEDPDGRSDLYSLGCVLYELLAGAPPFVGGATTVILARHVNETPAPITQHCPGVPATVAGALGRVLAKAPADRFATGSDFAQALTAAPTRPTPATGTKALVVLPFTNLSPDPENAYFADGLTEELIADLSKIRTLRVISRTSAMHFKGTTQNVRAIAAELNVRYVLEGSVRKAGNSVRITAQLIDAQEDSHLWTEKFTGTLDDVFEIQERVSRAISGALQLELTGTAEHAIADRPFREVRAYEDYLKARQAMWRFTSEAAGQAIEQLEQAHKLEGDNPAIEAGLAGAHFIMSRTTTRDVPHHVARTEEYARRALRLDPNLAQGHAWLGVACFKIPYGFIQGSVHLARAFQANPSDFDCLRAISWYFSEAGHLAAARLCVERLTNMDPLSPMAQCTAGVVGLMAGDPSSALERFEKAARLSDSRAWFVEAYRARGMAGVGQIEDAANRYATLGRDPPQDPFDIVSRFLESALRQRHDPAMAALTQQAQAVLRADETLSWLVAEGMAMIGERELAVDWLGEAAKQGFVNYPLLRSGDPFLEPLQGMPRFEEFLQGIEQTWRLFRNTVGELAVPA